MIGTNNHPPQKDSQSIAVWFLVWLKVTSSQSTFKRIREREIASVTQSYTQKIYSNQTRGEKKKTKKREKERRFTSLRIVHWQIESNEVLLDRNLSKRPNTSPSCQTNVWSIRKKKHIPHIQQLQDPLLFSSESIKKATLKLRAKPENEGEGKQDRKHWPTIIPKNIYKDISIEK